MIAKLNSLSGCTLIEPFAGGASVSLHMLASNTAERIVLFERDPLVYAFWYCVLFLTDDLVELIEKTDISLTTWKKLDALRDVRSPEGHNLLELGFAGLFFNRTNFSGILQAGPIGGMSQTSQYPINCRFNKEKIIEQITKINKQKEKIDIIFGDAIELTKKYSLETASKETLFFFDPPYFHQGNRLYRYYFEEKCHKNLARLLKSTNINWILTYDNQEYIKGLYSGTNVQTVNLEYSAKKSRIECELLISPWYLNVPNQNQDEVNDSEIDFISQNSFCFAK